MRSRILLSTILFSLGIFSPVHLRGQLRSVMVNACGTEGENEYVVLKNTGDPFVFQTDQIRLWYGTGLPASTPVCDSFCSSPNYGYIQALNARLDSSCNFRFRALRAGDSIRAKTYILIFHPTPTDTPDLNSWCGVPSDSVAVLFACGNKWRSGGNFANSPSSWRYLRLKFRSDTSDYRYSNGWSSSKDGNFVSFDTSGWNPSYGNYPSCNANSADALPVELVEFSAQRSQGSIELFWKTALEWNNSGFALERSTNGINWEHRTFIQGAGNSTHIRIYSFVDRAASAFSYYYRLVEVDDSGMKSPIGLIHVPAQSVESLYLYPNPCRDVVYICGMDLENFSTQTSDQLKGIGELYILDSQGIAYRATATPSDQCLKWALPKLSSGLYVITYVHRGGSEHWLVHRESD